MYRAITSQGSRFLFPSLASGISQQYGLVCYSCNILDLSSYSLVSLPYQVQTDFLRTSLSRITMDLIIVINSSIFLSYLRSFKTFSLSFLFLRIFISRPIQIIRALYPYIFPQYLVPFQINYSILPLGRKIASSIFRPIGPL